MGKMKYGYCIIVLARVLREKIVRNFRRIAHTSKS